MSAPRLTFRPNLDEMLETIGLAKRAGFEPIRWVLSPEWEVDLRARAWRNFCPDFKAFLGLPCDVTFNDTRFGALEVRTGDGATKLIQCKGLPTADARTA